MVGEDRFHNIAFIRKVECTVSAGNTITSSVLRHHKVKFKFQLYHKTEYGLKAAFIVVIGGWGRQGEDRRCKVWIVSKPYYNMICNHRLQKHTAQFKNVPPLKCKQTSTLSKMQYLKKNPLVTGEYNIGKEHVLE